MTSIRTLMPVQYDRLADRFDERYRHQPFPGIQSRLRRLASSPATNRVLEVGCGTGHWLNFLSDLPIDLVGIDASLGMVEKARFRVARAELVCASAESIPFQGSSFDLIFCVNAFHHFSDPRKFLGNGRALLRNGGRLAIFGLDPHAHDTEWYFYDYFAGLREKDLARYLSAGEIRQLMLEMGFATVVTETAERIEKTFEGDAVFEDPFLARESTSQLLLISQQCYLEGKRAIAAAVAKARGEGRSQAFRLNLILCVTVGHAISSG